MREPMRKPVREPMPEMDLPARHAAERLPR
jgi:hypothetical protein